MAQSSRQ